VRLNKIDMNLFVVFDAIYREGSVTRVAQQLNLTQPAVSNALNRLRQTFDDRLFIRTPEGMLPTPVADNAIADVRRALALLGKSISANAKFEPAKSDKRFLLAMNDLVQFLLLPVLLDKIQSTAPGVTLSCYYPERHSVTEELKSGETDLLVDAPIFNAREFIQASLMLLPYAVAMRKSNPLTKKPITLQSYLSAQHIHVSGRKKGRGHADIALHGLGHRRSVVLRVQDYLVAEELTSRSNLLWTVPRVLSGSSRLFYADTPFDVEPLKLNLYWGKNANDDPANQWLRELVVESAKAIR